MVLPDLNCTPPDEANEEDAGGGVQVNEEDDQMDEDPRCGATDDDEQANEEMYEQNLYEAALDESQDAVDEDDDAVAEAEDAVEMDEQDQHYTEEEPGGQQAGELREAGGRYGGVPGVGEVALAEGEYLEGRGDEERVGSSETAALQRRAGGDGGLDSHWCCCICSWASCSSPCSATPAASSPAPQIQRLLVLQHIAGACRSRASRPAVRRLHPQI
ncbi:hypothetical protein ACQ4PT_041114 [Festuca glaucescens]